MHITGNLEVGKDFLYKGKGEGKASKNMAWTTEDWKTDCPTNLCSINLETKTINEKCETRNSTENACRSKVNINKEDAFIYAKLVDDEGRKFYLNSPEDDLGFANGEKNAYLFQLNTRDGFFQYAYVLNISPMDGHVTLRTSMKDGVYAWSADPVNQMADDLSIGETDMYFWEDLNNSNVKRLDSNRVNPPDVKKEDYVRIWRSTDNLTVKQGNAITAKWMKSNPTAVDATETPVEKQHNSLSEDKPRGATRVKVIPIEVNFIKGGMNKSKSGLHIFSIGIVAAYSPRLSNDEIET
ncbi:hypothetical protein SPFM20_00100 [Salmonella phage SPFM20]|nr:hypothetical protein SPFM20_00100 [Salmonella phage SPFM20]